MVICARAVPMLCEVRRPAGVHYEEVRIQEMKNWKNRLFYGDERAQVACVSMH